MKRHFDKTLLLKTGGVLLGLVALFWALLTLAYCIPANAIKPHLEESYRIIASEDVYPASYVSSGISLDNFTVVVMLSEAAQCGGNPILDSLRSPCYLDNESMLDALQKSIEGESNRDYTRYWHGYLILLKPLLVFLNVQEIRLLFQTVFLVLLGIASVALARSMNRKGIAIAIALCLSMGLVGGADASATLPIFFSFAIALGALIWIASLPESQLIKTCKRAETPTSRPESTLLIGFMVIGALTVFFDFLDNPIITLGMPLVALVCRTGSSISLPQLLKICLICSLFWAIGYGGIWLSKWVLASIALGSNVIESAVNSIAIRSGMQNETGILEKASNAIAANYRLLGITQWLLVVELAAVLASLIVMFFSRADRARTKVIIRNIVVLLILSTIPLIWYAATSNHSMIHAHIIAYRTLVVQVFALTVAALFALNETIAAIKNRH